MKSERKPRKLIQYKDLGLWPLGRGNDKENWLLTDGSSATAVSRIDNLEFLSDVIPKTTTYKQFKEKRAKEKEPGPEKGQRTLNGNIPAAVEEKEEVEEQQSLQPVEDKPSRGSRPPTVTMMVDRTVDASAGDQDVEMTDQWRIPTIMSSGIIYMCVSLHGGVIWEGIILLGFQPVG